MQNQTKSMIKKHIVFSLDQLDSLKELLRSNTPACLIINENIKKYYLMADQYGISI